MRHALITLIGLGLIIFGCAGTADQFDPGDGAGKTAGKIAIPDSILDRIPVITWHGQIAGLDSTGRGGPAAGYNELRRLRVSSAGIPHLHSGQFKNRDYIADLRDSTGAQIMRTLPTILAMYGSSELNLGKMILACTSPDNPGPYIQALLDSIRLPADGLGFDIEENIQDRQLYAESREDAELARLWSFTTVRDKDYAEFRSHEIAIFYRLLYASFKARQPDCRFALVYSGWDEKEAKNRYGCDWRALTDKSLTWRGQALPPIDYAMVGYPGPTIPDKLQDWARQFSLPIFFNIMTYVPNPDQEAEFYRAKIQNLLPLVQIERGDGLAFVDFAADDYRGPQVWDKHDRLIAGILAEALGR